MISNKKVFVSVTEFSIKIICSLRQYNISKDLEFYLGEELNKKVKIDMITINGYKLNPSFYSDKSTRLILDNDELVVSLQILGSKNVPALYFIDSNLFNNDKYLYNLINLI